MWYVIGGIVALALLSRFSKGGGQFIGSIFNFGTPAVLPVSAAPGSPTITGTAPAIGSPAIDSVNAGASSQTVAGTSASLIAIGATPPPLAIQQAPAPPVAYSPGYAPTATTTNIGQANVIRISDVEPPGYTEADNYGLDNGYQLSVPVLGGNAWVWDGKNMASVIAGYKPTTHDYTNFRAYGFKTITFSDGTVWNA